MTSRFQDPLEDETCRDFVLPALDRAGWDEDRITPQYPINRGRIRATARRHRQERPLKADYLLEYSDGLPIAVVEAKRSRRDPADGYEQVKRYAELLDVPFAYTTNGRRTLEIDNFTGLVTEIDAFPSPEELWTRYREGRDLTDDKRTALAAARLNSAVRNWDGTPKEPRYYQRVAINRTVQAIARGDNRILLVLATGTGKTLVAAQIVAKLWNAEWPGGRRPRVLYLADRNILIDQPKDDYFKQMFGEAVHKLGGGDAKTGRNIYLGLYQSLDSSRDAESLYRQFRPDYFDLVIVDECHRGSATEGSQWRAILEYFSPAVQLGLTATPISTKDADTYHYFGDPIYEYSLARGIEDGFLAPYRVRKVRLNVDMTGWRPDPGQRDLLGREIPDKLYGPKEYERILAILDRTEEAARYLTEYLHRTNRMGKTIVFCANSDHAMRMTTALHNANADLSARYGSKYVVRITAKDGDPGRELLDEFREVETEVPVIAVTSRLLSTGVDAPTVRNIVLFRGIKSMPEFKQIIGRGTRLFPEDGKFSFDIIDFVEATRLFNDPGFDGPPMRVVRDETDEQGSIVDSVNEDVPGADEESVAEPGDGFVQEDGGSLPPLVTDPAEVDDIQASPRTFYVDGVQVTPWGSALYVSEPGSGGGLRLVESEQFVRGQILKLDLEPHQLLGQWAGVKSRATLREKLDESHITAQDLAEWAGRPDADTIDLLLYLAWELPLLSRSERARRVATRHREFLQSFAPEARKVLDRVLDLYAARGAEELEIPALRSGAYADLGNILELSKRFGGREQLVGALDELNARVYDAS
ncbi:EcoAI/FtnUII family type I restriction enzme subunit R [Spirillospora albida]|uniref:EcoAI/FtnUII family type I restriction enzme subunit R n=1 Tax=Spirillospora albida TaxID=58123 RepID=UPI0004C10D92|nr:type I restriction endonuclease subunit R [Spirillospora albida]